jgi:hypothetical protein
LNCRCTATLPLCCRAADSCRSAAAYGLVPLKYPYCRGKVPTLPLQNVADCRCPMFACVYCVFRCRHTAADCRCVENNSCFNVVGKTLFNLGQWQKNRLVTVECPDTFETTNYCNTKQLNVCCKYNYRRLLLQCHCHCRCMWQKHCCGKIPLPILAPQKLHPSERPCLM